MQDEGWLSSLAPVSAKLQEQFPSAKFDAKSVSQFASQVQQLTEDILGIKVQQYHHHSIWLCTCNIFVDFSIKARCQSQNGCNGWAKLPVFHLSLPETWDSSPFVFPEFLSHNFCRPSEATSMTLLAHARQLTDVLVSERLKKHSDSIQINGCVPDCFSQSDDMTLKCIALITPSKNDSNLWCLLHLQSLPPRPFPKVPSALFRDVQPDGSLHTILAKFHQLMSNRSLKRVDFTNPYHRKQACPFWSQLTYALRTIVMPNRSLLPTCHVDHHCAHPYIKFGIKSSFEVWLSQDRCYSNVFLCLILQQAIWPLCTWLSLLASLILKSACLPNDKWLCLQSCTIMRIFVICSFRRCCPLWWMSCCGRACWNIPKCISALPVVLICQLWIQW